MGIWGWTVSLLEQWSGKVGYLYNLHNLPKICRMFRIISGPNLLVGRTLFPSCLTNKNVSRYCQCQLRVTVSLDWDPLTQELVFVWSKLNDQNHVHMLVHRMKKGGGKKERQAISFLRVIWNLNVSNVHISYARTWSPGNSKLRGGPNNSQHAKSSHSKGISERRIMTMWSHYVYRIKYGNVSAGPNCVRFSRCDQIPEKSNFKDRFILAHGFRNLTPWLAGTIPLRSMAQEKHHSRRRAGHG